MSIYLFLSVGRTMARVPGSDGSIGRNGEAGPSGESSKMPRYPETVRNALIPLSLDAASSVSLTMSSQGFPVSAKS